jgi:hypothetical protein
MPSAPRQVNPLAQTLPKKAGPLIWVLVGCLVLAVAAAIIVASAGLFVAHKAKQAGFDAALFEKNPSLAVAKIMASVNPDVEVLSVDEARGVISVRDKKTGKTLTVNLEDAKNGRIVFQDEKNQRVEVRAHGEGEAGALEVRSSEGTMRMGSAAARLPVWLPAYPGAEEAGTFGMSTEKANTGTCSYKTAAGVDEVATFYENALAQAGFEVRRTAAQVPGQGSAVILSAQDAESRRTAQITATAVADGTSIALVFEDKK